MTSRNQKPGETWKTRLLAAKKLDGRIGVCIYRRTKLLAAIFEDSEFRAEVGARDDLEAADWLDAEFKGVALKFLQLRAMLAEFPRESQWADGDLQKMYAAVKPVAATEKTTRTRTSIKVADHEKVCQERDHFQARVTYLEERITELERERADHRQTIAKLQGQVEELERLLDRTAERNAA